MKRYVLIYLSLLILGAFPVAGQDFAAPVGARAAGMSSAAVSLTDVWSITNNIAGIAKLEKPVIGAIAETRFGLQAFTTVGLAGIYPVKGAGVIGTEISRFGDKIYNEQQIGVGYAHKIGPVQLGLKANFLQLHINELGSKRTVAFSFGGQSEIIPKLTFGAHIYNLNQATIADYAEERLPTIMKAGLGYQLTEKLLLCLETEKNINLPADIKGGIEYNLVPKLALRTGFSTATQSVSGGVGFTAKALQIDFGLGSYSTLGLRNQLSVSYQFN